MNKMKEEKTFGLKGTFVYSQNQQDIKIRTGTAICDDGICMGIFEQIPKKYQGIKVEDFSGNIIVPGMIDLHIHAPQYQFRTIGMDMELLDWLNTYTFPEESKYSDIEYAKHAYSLFIDDLKDGMTTRACIFATLHKEATLLLMDMLDETGLITMTGLVNMDRNSPDYLCDESAEKSIEKTIDYIEKSVSAYSNTVPILTPRFIPSCSDELMKELGILKQKYKLPLQSHLSENLSEIDWVKELCEESDSYSDAYYRQGAFHTAGKTVMAHCVHLTEKEVKLLKEYGVFIAHCAESNINLASGIAPIRRYINENIKIGLGTDVAAGTSTSMFQAIIYTIQVSKLYWQMVNKEMTPLTIDEAFYIATKGGGEFFGKVGSFEAGYEFDAVILKDTDIKSAKKLTDRERFERLLYLATNKNVVCKYVAGRRIIKEG